MAIYVSITYAIWELVCLKAGIKGRDKELHPTDTVGCNYLSLSLISPSGTNPHVMFIIPSLGIDMSVKLFMAGYFLCLYTAEANRHGGYYDDGGKFFRTAKGMLGSW